MQEGRMRNERGQERLGNTVRVANHSEAMVLGGDEHLPRAEVAHGVVPAAMAISHLRGLPPERQTDQLVPEADAEGRQAAAGELAHAADGVAHRGGIPRPIGKKKPVRV